MKTILFSLWGLDFYSHGVLLTLGIILATLVALPLARQRQLDNRWLLDNLVYIILFGIVGSRLAYVLIYHKQVTDISQVFAIWQGGLISWGGMVTGLLIILILLHRQKEKIYSWLDVLMVSFLLGVAVSRLGGWLADDVPGVTGSSFLTINGRYPIALIEAGLDFLLFLALLSKFAKVGKGVMFWWGLLGYALIRTILSAWRIEETIWLLKIGQLTGIIVLLISLLGLLKINRER